MRPAPITWCLLPILVTGVTAVASPAEGARMPFSAPFAIGHSDHGREIAPLSLLHTAADGQGDLAIGWTNTHARGTQSLELALRRVDGPLRRARTIYTAPGALSQPALAMDRRGDTLVVFTRYSDGFTRRTVMVIDVSHTGHVGRATPISPADAPSELASVAESPAGEAVVVFQRDASAPPRSAGFASAVPEDVMAVTRTPGGRFGAAVAISPTDPRAASGGTGTMNPTVAVSAGGAATAAWNLEQVPATISENGTGIAQAASAPPGGSFGTPVTLGSTTVQLPVFLAEDPAGDTLASWTDATGALVAAGAPAGTPGVSSPTTLSDPNAPGQITLNGTASIVSADGEGRVLWTDGGADHAGQLATASWMPGGPVTAGTPVTAHATVGPRGSFPPYTGNPSTVPLGTRTLVAWQESALQTDGRDGSGSNSLVTLEYAVASSGDAFGAGRLALRRGVAASTGLLPASTLVGGGSGRVYLAFMRDSGAVFATRLIAVG